jgi:hypothetical protein
MRANTATANDDDDCVSKLRQAFIGKEDSVPSELFEDQVLMY